MRTAFILSFVANLVLAVAALILSPATVAIHFGYGGEPDGWAPAYVSALIMVGANGILFLALCFVPSLIRRTPARWINLPNREYWLREENRSKMTSLLSEMLYQFGTLTFIFMFVVGLLSLQANLSNPVRLQENLFWWPLGMYLACAVIWMLRLIRIFRIPKGGFHF
jgi:uncharacterized membrane protein